MGIHELPNGKFRLQIRRSNLTIDEVYPTRAKAQAAFARFTEVRASKRKNETTLDDLWTLYRDSLAFAQKRERTKDTEVSRIKRILNVMGTFPLSAITSLKVEQYITDRLNEHPTPSADAIRLEVAALSAVMNFARKRALIPANPCIGVGRPSAPRKIKRFQPEDEGGLMSLLSHPRLRFRFAARLCLLVRETGARPGEWVKAHFSDVNFEKRTILFRETKYKAQPRTVPMTAAAQELLLAQMEDVTIHHLDTFGNTDLLFPAVGKDGEMRPFHYTGALRDIKRLGLLPKTLRAHTGRHEFISTLVESTDLDDSRIMALVGHHSPASMEVYKHVRNIRFRPMIEEIEPQRRSERMRAVAKVLNLPPRLIEVMLLREREVRTTAGLQDDGDELLFTADFINQLHALASELGSAPKSRMDTIARLRELLQTQAQEAPVSASAVPALPTAYTSEPKATTVKTGKRKAASSKV